MAKEMVSIGTRVDVPFYREIQTRAAKRKISVSRYLRESLREQSEQVRLSRNLAEDLLVLLDERLMEENLPGLKTMRGELWDSLGDKPSA